MHASTLVGVLAAVMVTALTAARADVRYEDTTPAGKIGVGVLAVSNIAAESLFPADLTRADGPKAVGSLTFVGGAVLEHPHMCFGGFSALWVDPKATAEGHRRFLALSDVGYRLHGTLQVDADRRAVRVNAVAFEPLLGPAGAQLNQPPASGSKCGAPAKADIESMMVMDGAIWAAVERSPRILVYGNGIDRPATGTVPLPKTFDPSPAKNNGAEGMTRLPGGGTLYLILQEGDDTGGGGPTRTALRRDASNPAADTALVWPLAGPEVPTAAALGPDGYVYVVERFYDKAMLKTFIRIRRVAGAAVLAASEGTHLEPETLAEMGPGLLTGNFEGIAAVPNGADSVRLFIMSDDNHKSKGTAPIADQETLLLVFDVPRGR